MYFFSSLHTKLISGVTPDVPNIVWCVSAPCFLPRTRWRLQGGRGVSPPRHIASSLLPYGFLGPEPLFRLTPVLAGQMATCPLPCCCGAGGRVGGPSAGGGRQVSREAPLASRRGSGAFSGLWVHSGSLPATRAEVTRGCPPKPFLAGKRGREVTRKPL